MAPEAPSESIGPACTLTSFGSMGFWHRMPSRARWWCRKSVFNLDLEHGQNRGSELEIIAAIPEAPVIEKILTHQGLQPRVPPWAPARARRCERPDAARR